jgi:hypothetical protein
MFQNLLTFALLATITVASVTIEEICQYTLPTKQPAIICLRADQPLNGFPKEITATASIGVTPVKLCCKSALHLFFHYLQLTFFRQARLFLSSQ